METISAMPRSKSSAGGDERRVIMEKEWWKSQTLWGGIIMAIAFIVGLLGYSITTQEQKTMTDLIISIATPLGELIGLIMLIIGRVKVGKQLKMAKGIIAKSFAEGDEKFPRNWIWIFEKIFGKDANAVFSTGMFLISEEGRTMLKAIKTAAKTDKGKILIEQIEKIT
jgi:type II secretory pathway component PulF